MNSCALLDAPMMFQRIIPLIFNCCPWGPVADRAFHTEVRVTYKAEFVRKDQLRFPAKLTGSYFDSAGKQGTY